MPEDSTGRQKNHVKGDHAVIVVCIFVAALATAALASCQLGAVPRLGALSNTSIDATIEPDTLGGPGTAR